MKEQVDIERLVEWAYRVQCVDRRTGRRRPSGPAQYPTAAPFMQFVALGTRVDSSGLGVHGAEVVVDGLDDADMVHNAVLALGNMWIEWRGDDDVVVWTAEIAAREGRVIDRVGEDWFLFPAQWSSSERPEPVPLEDAGVSILLIVHGRAGSRPDWHEGWKPLRGVQAGDACPRDRRGRRRKQAGVVSPQDVAHARAIYAVWHAALAVLAEDLRGVLSQYEAMAPAAPEAPWMLSEKRVMKAL